jgi:Phytanoyl-CoA dioxygenase (PhyH)
VASSFWSGGLAHVDQRTRLDEDRPLLEPDAFFGRELPEAIEAQAECILPALDFVAPRPCAFEIDDHAWTLRVGDGHVVVREGFDDTVAALVRLNAQQLTDLAADQQTFMSLWASNHIDQPKGNIGHLCDWWLVLRAALDGAPIYTPGTVTFVDRDGVPLDLERVFRPDDDVDEMRHFLREAGFLHISRVFDEDEMGTVCADMDRAVSSYTRDDGRSWWARTADGAMRLVRMQGFDRESEAVQELIGDDRFVGLASIPGAGHEFSRTRAKNRIEALFKPVGVTEGISDIPWHKDCGIGRHSYECCGLTIGISVTGADGVSGQLRALAGSHRALVWSGIRQPDLDLPDVPLPTETGDVTLHLSCTMHMAQPPLARERRVMYSGFSLPPLEGADPAAVAAARARRGAVRETAPLTVLDRHFKS